MRAADMLQRTSYCNNCNNSLVHKRHFQTCVSDKQPMCAQRGGKIFDTFLPPLMSYFYNQGFCNWKYLCMTRRDFLTHIQHQRFYKRSQFLERVLCWVLSDSGGTGWSRWDGLQNAVNVIGATPEQATQITEKGCWQPGTHHFWCVKTSQPMSFSLRWISSTYASMPSSLYRAESSAWKGQWVWEYNSNLDAGLTCCHRITVKACQRYKLKDKAWIYISR